MTAGQRREIGTKISRRAAAAIAVNLLLSLDASENVILNTATTKPLGQSMDTVDDTEMVGVRLPSDGILELTAAAAITIGVPVYGTASGKITSTAVQGAYCIGIAMRAALADGNVIPVLPLLTPFVVQDLAAVTYAAPEAGALNTGDGGSDTVIASLRTQLIALAADFADLRAKVIAAGIAIT